MNISSMHPSLNETQVYLLQEFARANNDEERAEIQALLLECYRKRVDAHARNISWNNEEIEGILTSYHRTPYKGDLICKYR